MKSILREIAEIMAEVSGVDVEVTDATLFRVAGTGLFAAGVGQDMSQEGYTYRQVLDGQPIFVMGQLHRLRQENTGYAVVATFTRTREMHRSLSRMIATVGSGTLVGSSAHTEQLRKEIAKIARSPSTVLILGESATGLVVAPGFIDTHSHSDLRILEEPEVQPKVMQGITTEILGQDGISMAPLPVEYISPWRKNLAGLDGDSDNINWEFKNTAGYLAMIDAVKPHPRVYGAFPRILGKYVREDKALTLEEAVYKMTKKPATTFNMEGRGEIQVGNYADITIFNPDTVIDKGTFTDPVQFPEGIEYVLVNGGVTVAGGKHTGHRSGVVLRQKDKKVVK